MLPAPAKELLPQLVPAAVVLEAKTFVLAVPKSKTSESQDTLPHSVPSILSSGTSPLRVHVQVFDGAGGVILRSVLYVLFCVMTGVNGSPYSNGLTNISSLVSLSLFARLL